VDRKHEADLWYVLCSKYSEVKTFVFRTMEKYVLDINITRIMWQHGNKGHLSKLGNVYLYGMSWYFSVHYPPLLVTFRRKESCCSMKAVEFA
jgi:hypothetical protein